MVMTMVSMMISKIPHLEITPKRYLYPGKTTNMAVWVYTKIYFHSPIYCFQFFANVVLWIQIYTYLYTPRLNLSDINRMKKGWKNISMMKCFMHNVERAAIIVNLPHLLVNHWTSCNYRKYSPCHFQHGSEGKYIWYLNWLSRSKKLMKGTELIK